jgi:short-subunit dehydrogenase
MNELKNIVWITGASAGIGRAVSLELARRGYDLVLTARRQELLESLAEEAEALGASVAICTADVTDRDVMLQVPEKAAEQLGREGIDVAIANAGIIHSGPFETVTAEQSTKIIDVNVNGVIHTCHAVIPKMLERGRGHVVAISSIAGTTPLPSRPAYTASKAAVNCYIESLRLELEPRGINTTLVLPGYVESDMTAKNKQKMPFFWSADRAARRIVAGIEKKQHWVAFPWQMHLAIKLSKALPRPIRDNALRRQVSIRD